MSSLSSNLAGIRENNADGIFMERCLQLAGLGAGFTAPNPLVGAVLVHEGRIIGEGYHQQFGGPHAEVNCIESVQVADRWLIPLSTLYVSLEPCCHYGKTPPCTDLIIREKIPLVVIGCRDPFPEVNGKGIEKLQASGIGVVFPVLEQEAKEKNHRFFTFHEKNRPYIILKWAESVNHKIAGKGGKRIQISNDYSTRLVHKWRSEEAGILIGTNTALMDNPELTTRLWDGKNPVRIVVDEKLRLPDSLKIFDGIDPTIVLNGSNELSAGKILFKRITGQHFSIESILSAIHEVGIISILVEGGLKLIQSFIDSGSWDEIRIITNNALEIPEGISSPEIKDAKFLYSETYRTDIVRYFRNEKGT
jgi:diaminohydroxyphosphoribosylaminopyrimidine deaminase/5-amino-6-(5-phosphoribosylamino)uracil reductase